MQLEHILKDYNDVLTPGDVKEILQIGRNATYQYLADGTIKSIKIRGKYRIPKLNLLKFLYPDISDDVTTEGRDINGSETERWET